MKRSCGSRRAAGRRSRSGCCLLPGGQPLLRVERRHGLHAVSRDRAELRHLAYLQPSGCSLQRLSRRVPLSTPASTWNNLRRVCSHVRGDVPEQVHLRNGDIPAMMERCRSCHRQEFADWQVGPHSSTYARIFLDAEAQQEASADGRLPALPRHAFRRRHSRPGDAREYHGSVEPAAAELASPARRFRAWRATRCIGRANCCQSGAPNRKRLAGRPRSRS